MKWLLLTAFCSSLLLFAPSHAQAQTGYGCGEADYIDVGCNAPCNSRMWIFWYTGYQQGDTEWWAIFTVQCGSGQGCTQRVDDAAQAGYCDNGDATSGTHTASDAPADVEDTVYVDAYVRDCKGQYLPTRIPI